MNLKITPPKKTAPMSAVAARADITARISNLNQLHSKLITELMELQKGMVTPIDLVPAPDLNQLAAQYARGDTMEISQSGEPRERLSWVMAHATAVERALVILNNENIHLFAPALTELMSQRGMTWNGIVRRRAMALIELRKANAEARSFRRDLMRTLKGGANLGLVCEFLDFPSPLFATPVVGDPAYLFLSECVKAGICTQSEIAEAINHLQGA